LQTRQAIDLSGYTPSELWMKRCRDGKVSINPEHDDFPALLAECLDLLFACQFDARHAAGHSGCSATQIVRLLERDPRALALINQQRQAAGKAAYR
jgi:hypothetical protein